MPFLSHSIPWLSLSGVFEWHPPRTRPGPQEGDLWGKEGPAYRKQLEHFAREFQKTVREHAVIERGRYSTAQAYRDRAATWTKSSVEEPPEQGQETRRVYPTYFSDIYMSLEPTTLSRSSLSHGLVESLADISMWIDYCSQPLRYHASWQDWIRDELASYKLGLGGKPFSDVLRLLLIDAGTTNDEAQRTRRLSTLLLLANHPGVNLKEFMSEDTEYCNIQVGFVALVDKTTMVFIYLNLLLALAEGDQQGELLRPCYTLEEWPDTSHGKESLMRLTPRPAYMNSRSFTRVLEYALNEHVHAVEHVLFNPIFAPRSSGCRSKWLHIDDWAGFEGNDEVRFERDVMAARESLGEALKQMWRVLIFCDMVLCEANMPINWEKASHDAIWLLFGNKGIGKVVGMYMAEYEAELEEERPFKYWANSSKDCCESIAEILKKSDKFMEPQSKFC